MRYCGRIRHPPSEVSASARRDDCVLVRLELLPAGVDPNKGMTAVRELEHAVKELGLRGLNLSFA